MLLKIFNIITKLIPIFGVIPINLDFKKINPNCIRVKSMYFTAKGYITNIIIIQDNFYLSLLKISVISFSLGPTFVSHAIGTFQLTPNMRLILGIRSSKTWWKRFTIV